MNSKQVLKTVTKACQDKQANDITILNMDQISLIADYFLICHASNERQVQAIAKGVKDSLDESNIHVKNIEGLQHARWVIVDTGYVICHIFHEEERRYYNLERLWGDAPELSLPVQESE